MPISRIIWCDHLSYRKKSNNKKIPKAVTNTYFKAARFLSQPQENLGDSKFYIRKNWKVKPLSFEFKDQTANGEDDKFEGLNVYFASTAARQPLSFCSKFLEKAVESVLPIGRFVRTVRGWTRWIFIIRTAHTQKIMHIYQSRHHINRRDRQINTYISDE